MSVIRKGCNHLIWTFSFPIPYKLNFVKNIEGFTYLNRIKVRAETVGHFVSYNGIN